MPFGTLPIDQVNRERGSNPPPKQQGPSQPLWDPGTKPGRALVMWQGASPPLHTSAQLPWTSSFLNWRCGWTVPGPQAVGKVGGWLSVPAFRRRNAAPRRSDTYWRAHGMGHPGVQPPLHRGRNRDLPL